MALYPDSLYDFPNVSAYDSDLREVLAMLRGLTNKMRDFEVVNKITNAGAWDITKQYKPWTIVSDNNIGYISVRPVPAGIEITNTDYWALVADYDILITNLSERISALERDSINIHKEIDLITTKKAVFLGDSYQFIGSGWVDGVAAGIGIASGNYFNYCVSGHGFTVEGGKWINDLALFVTEHGDILNEITDIIIVGGINDSGAENLDATIDEFFAYANAHLPNAKVTMAFVGNASINSPVLAGRTVEKRLACFGTERIAFARNGGTYLSGTENILWQYTLMQSDLLHPNTFGVEKIIEGVVQAINAGSCDIIGYKNIAPNVTSNYTEYFNNGLYNLDINMMHIPGGTVLSSTPVEIGQELAYAAQISANETDHAIAYIENRLSTTCDIIPVVIYMAGHKIMAGVAYAANAGAYPTYTLGNNAYLSNARMRTIAQKIL